MAAIKCLIKGINPNGLITITDGNKTIDIRHDDLDRKIKEHKVEITNTIKVKCLQKQRDKHNNITAYLIQDRNGNRRVFTPKELKSAIYNFQIDCINLTLTSDGRLVDTTPDSTEKAPYQAHSQTPSQAPKKIPDEPKKVLITDYILTKDILKETLKFIQNDLIKALGMDTTEKEHKPSAVEILFGSSDTNIFDQLEPPSELDHAMAETDINICIIGRGANKDLTSIKGIKKINETNLGLLSEYTEGEYRATVFCMNRNDNLKLPSDCRRLISDAFKSGFVATLILNGIDWSDVETTEEMFYDACINNIKILNSEAPKLKNMYGMYKRSSVESVDMQKFIVPNVERTTAMFCKCDNIDPNKVNISGLSFKNVKYVGMMFYTENFLAPKMLGMQLIGDNSEERKLHIEIEADKLIQQCKDLGWKGYPDGREDDFTTTLSSPKQYYPDEIERVQRKHDRRHNRKNWHSRLISKDNLDILKQIYNLE